MTKYNLNKRLCCNKMEIKRKRNSIDYYDICYNVLCVSYSKAYLSGSPWYVGESLRDWFLDLSRLMTGKMVKYLYITEIIDEFMNIDQYSESLDVYLDDELITNESITNESILLKELEILESIHHHIKI